MAARPTHTFRMDSLLSEMREIEGRQIQPRLVILARLNDENANFRPGPGVAVLARTGETLSNLLENQLNAKIKDPFHFSKPGSLHDNDH